MLKKVVQTNCTVYRDAEVCPHPYALFLLLLLLVFLYKQHMTCIFHESNQKTSGELESLSTWKGVFFLPTANENPDMPTVSSERQALFKQLLDHTHSYSEASSIPPSLPHTIHPL